MNQRKKSKFRRRINRMKNKYHYLRKRVGVSVTCFLLCFSLIAVTLFATKQQAYATGVEEMLYYTYWDLISGLFSEVGYQYSVTDEYYTSPKRASGEQIWDNFCTWVENKAKVLSLPVEVVNDTIFKELENLPNVVNAAGVSMSEALAQLLGTVLPTAATDEAMKNQFDCSSVSSVSNMIASICGIKEGIGYLFDVSEDACNGLAINIVRCGDGSFNIFSNREGYRVIDYMVQPYQNVWVYLDYLSPDDKVTDSGSLHAAYVTTSHECKTAGAYPRSARAPVTWIVKNGAFAGADGIAQSDYARVKVKEKTEDQDGVYIPGVGWKTKWEIWDDIINNDPSKTQEEKDEFWARYHVNEMLKDLPDSSNVDPDDEKRRKEDNNKDRLPVVLPIPFKPSKDTEKETESESEKDTEPAPGPIPKPDPTEDGSEDDTESQKHIQDVITNAGGSSGGNWKKLFPFCIPWDIMTLIKSMNAEKKAPHFKYEHTFKGINYTFSIDVDMSDYWKYIKIFRWGMTIFFIIGLFFLTVKFTTFVHRGS